MNYLSLGAFSSQVTRGWKWHLVTDKNHFIFLTPVTVNKYSFLHQIKAKGHEGHQILKEVLTGSFQNLNTIFCFLCIIVGNKPGLELIKKAWKCLFVIKTGGCADTNQLISKSLEPQSCNLIGQLPFASFCTFSSQSPISPHIIIKR